MMRRTLVVTLVAFAAFGALAHSQDVFTAGEAGLSDPVPVTAVRPVYPAAAIPVRIEGQVDLQAVVLPNGTVSDVLVIKPLDEDKYGVDQAAVAALKQWKFRPGSKDGKSVAVRITLAMAIQPPN